MPFIDDDAAYEAWLRKQCDVVEADLALKHERMAKNVFRFMRATYFRWARTIETLCPDLATAPAVLAVGDLHLENFGTWRDAEGRLVWGVNDFDDAAIMPYAFDLVRLCTSVRLTDSLAIKTREAAASILAGYREGLAAPRPSLLDGQEAWLRPFLAASDAERRKFWQDIDELTPAEPAKAIVKGFKKSFPDGTSDLKIFTQSKGGGSLGRPRFVATAEWQGGRIVREGKAVIPSAWEWAHDAAKGATSHFLDLAESAHRSPDPFLISHDGFIFRRLSPDARKLDLEQGVPAGLEALFLHAMGFELGSLHAADKNSGAIPAHLSAQPKSWLADAAKAAADGVKADFKEWKQAAEAKGEDKSKPKEKAKAAAA
jgi:Ser/Thr protein kinase RdoA (MazF antagonist)